MSFLKRYSDFLLIIVLLAFTILPLFSPGWFPIHDDEQIGRLFELNKDVMTGQIPPRLAQDLGFGFDYPLFNFYPSFIYYVAEIFHLIGFSYISSTKLMIAFGFILAGIFMYLFAKDYVGRIGGVVAAIAYSYAPYHSVDVYVRGALPEFWSFVFIPALFWSFHQLVKKGSYLFIILSGLFVAGLALTHDLIAMMSSFFLGAYFLFLLFQAKNRLQVFKNICISVLLGLSFSAYFWLPAYFEKQFTMVYLLTEQRADYHLYFVCIKQFLYSPWGYGGSIPGCSDGISFQVGQAQLLLALVSIVFSAFFVWKKRKGYGIAFLFIFMFFFSLFIQTKYSASIWDTIQPFSYIQFPWRFLIFSDFTVAFLIAFVFSQITKVKIKITVAAIMIILLILLNKNYFQPSKYLTTITDADYTDLSVITWRTSTMSYEYTPKGIAVVNSDNGNAVIKISKSEIPSSNYTIIHGKMTVTPVEDRPQQKVWQASVMQQGVVRLNTFTFPGWKVFIDDKQVGYDANNKFRMITIDVPAGQHTIRATFTDTPIRTLANSVTVLSLLGVIGWGILKRKK